MSVEYYDDSLDSADCAPSPQYARISFYDQSPYLMQKERLIIGRNSAAGSVDIDVGAVTFVSRKHLELTYSYQKLKVKCLGKNGIFIDNNFKSHSFIPYELPPKCTLRFPSTDVQFCVEQLVGIKSADRLRPYGRLKSNIRYITDNDESPNYKRMKMNSRSEQDSTSNDNQESGYPGFREVIGNLTDNEVEEYIHNEEDDEDARKINNSDCDGLMNDGNGENDGVLIDNIGSYSFDTNGLINNTSKEYSIENIKSNDINSTNILRGIDNQSSVSNRPSVTKLVFNNIHCSNDQYFSNEGQIAVLEQDDLTIEHGSDTQKPPYSYAQLIVQAVSTARDRQLTLNGIYNYISKNYPYFKAHDKGWQNSVRHNLSLNRYFIKVPRGQDEPGKGSFWRVDPTYESKLIAQAFRKRRLRNNNTSMVNENGMVSQVLNVSNMDSSSQSSNTKLFGINKSCHLTSNRTANFGNVITLKRACDMNTQSGGTTYMLSGSGITSNGEPQKYIVSNRSNNNSNFESLSNVASNKTGSIFKCQSSKSVFIDGNNIKISGTSNVSAKSRPVQIRSQGNNSGTLISLGGRLFSTANIKSLQIQQQSQPRIINNSSFESSISTKASAITNTINPKNNNYYIISPSGLKNQKSLNSSYEDNNSVQSQISLTGPNRRIISIQTSHSPNIHKIDLSNGNMNKDGQLKSPIIFKKIKINNNFISLKSPEPKNININEVTSRFTIRSCEKTTYHRNNHDDNLSDDDIKLEPDNHVFISDRDIDNSEMDHFLISHSDPSVVSALPLQERSEPGSSPDLYKHDDDDIWPEDEVKSLKYTSIHDDGIVDGECD